MIFIEGNLLGCQPFGAVREKDCSADDFRQSSRGKGDLPTFLLKGNRLIGDEGQETGKSNLTSSRKVYFSRRHHFYYLAGGFICMRDLSYNPVVYQLSKFVVISAVIIVLLSSVIVSFNTPAGEVGRVMATGVDEASSIVIERIAVGETITGNNNTLHSENGTVRGNNNTLHGDGNTISGNNNTIHGDNNIIAGNNNTVRGANNRITGNNNRFTRDAGNIVAGGNNNREIR